MAEAQYEGCLGVLEDADGLYRGDLRVPCRLLGRGVGNLPGWWVSLSVRIMRTG